MGVGLRFWNEVELAVGQGTATYLCLPRNTLRVRLQLHAQLG